ncbi:carbohydrate kinase family protein [Isosphaeraceae bacterium EP7]
MPAATPSSAPAVVCAGIIVADHLCTPIDHIPAAGELVPADELVLNIGGCATNAAMNLTRLGVHATVCGKVGDDVFGRFVAQTLTDAGVDVGGIRIDPDRATSQSLIINVRGQDRRFIHAVSASKGFVAADIDAALAAGMPKVLYVGGYLILPGLDPAALADRFAKVRASGGWTMLDVVTTGPGNHLDLLRPVLPQTDLFLPNTDEAAIILGEHDPVRQALAFRAMGARRVVITCGDKGSVVASEGFNARVGAYPVNFVDGSGGGDAFDSGYIAGLVDGLPELECLKLASAVGASCVRAVGTTAGVFNRAEADAFIAQHSLSVETF